GGRPAPAALSLGCCVGSAAFGVRPPATGSWFVLRGQFPKSQFEVLAQSHHVLSVGRNREATDGSHGRPGAQLLAALHVPQLDDAVAAARDKAASVAGETEAGALVRDGELGNTGVADKAAHLAARFRVPETELGADADRVLASAERVHVHLGATHHG